MQVARQVPSAVSMTVYFLSSCLQLAMSRLWQAVEAKHAYDVPMYVLGIIRYISVHALEEFHLFT